MRAGIVVALALVIVAGLTLVFAPDASAIVCPPPKGYKSIGGTCYFVNGVEIFTTLKFTGSLNRNPKSFRSDITPTQNALGILFCGNNGGNSAPGQRLIPFTSALSCETQIFPSDVTSSQNGGTAENVQCSAMLSPTELDALDIFCSSGQFAIDFIPCDFNSVVKYKSLRDDTIIEEALHICTLPSCETLRWDNKAGMPEFRQYDCKGPCDESNNFCQ